MATLQDQLEFYKDDPAKLAAIYAMYSGAKTAPTTSSYYTPQVQQAEQSLTAQRSYTPGVVSGLGGAVIPNTGKPIDTWEDALAALGKDKAQAYIREQTGYTGPFEEGAFGAWAAENGMNWDALKHSTVNYARDYQGRGIGSTEPGYGFSYDPSSPNYGWPAIYNPGPLLGPTGGPGGIAQPARPGGTGTDPYFGDYTGGPLFNPGSGGYVAPGGTGGADSPVGGGKAVRNMAALRPYMQEYPWMMPDAIYTPEMMYGDTMPMLQRGIEQRFGWNPISIPTDMYYRPPIYRPETVNLQNLIPAAAAEVAKNNSGGGDAAPTVGSPEFWDSLRASGIYS